MNDKSLSRRDFLRLTALTAAGLTAAHYGVHAAQASSAPLELLTAAPPAAEEVVLDVVHDLPEVDNAYRQILDLFGEENPGVRVNLISHSEDGMPAYAAKVAGGYCPAMETVASVGNTTRINKENYQNYVDLSTIGFPYFDLWTYDVKNAWSAMYDGLPGPRCLSPFLGWVSTWAYHVELMEKVGVDPREEVKTWDDMKKWLDKGTQWAKSADSGVNYFWDQGWLPDWFGAPNTMDMIPLAFPDGQYEQQVACYKGEAAFNAKDSPYRHTFEFFKEAYDKDWVPRSFWTREWESDMEATYAGGKAVVQLHGPWVWETAQQANPETKQLGFPSTPPAEGQSQWMQWMADLEIDYTINAAAYCIRACNEKSPNWEMIKKLFIWWHSPDIVRLRCEATGSLSALKLDPPPDIQSPQYLGVIKEIGTPGGKYENVKFQTQPSGEMLMAGKRKPGSPGVWDYESGNNSKYWADLMEGRITVQDVLDMAQKNWEASYT